MFATEQELPPTGVEICVKWAELDNLSIKLETLIFEEGSPRIMYNDPMKGKS